MKLPTKFRINTDDFKIYFDNSKKTHVCENVETGEKTNIGVLGILMQMGILKPIEENRGMDDRIKFLSEKIESLENKINEVMKSIDSVPIKERQKEIEQKTEEPEEEIEEESEEVEEKPKSEIKKRIMKKVLEQTEEKEEPEEKVNEEVEEEESDAVVESDEEIDNWMKI
jgi:hypothetical protein